MAKTPLTPELSQTIWLSIKVASAAVALICIPGVAFGWLFARRDFPGKLLADTLVNLPLVLPPIVTGYFLLIVFGRNGVAGRWLYETFGLALTFTWQAASLAAAVVAFPLFVRAVRVAIENIDPKIEEAGRVLRANAWRVFLKITLPLSRNGIIAGILLAFARGLGEFGATIMIAGNIPGETQTIPLAIFSFVNQPGGEKRAFWLILFSIGIAYGSLLVSEILLRRWRNRKD